MSSIRRNLAPGFTIVELLIVIVVIAILAAITLVAFTGIREQSQASAVQSDLSSMARKIELYHVEESTYPADLATLGLTTNPSFSATYRMNTSSNPATYCLTMKSGSIPYSVWRDSGSVKQGLCIGFDYATNGSVELGTASQGWNATSGASVEQSSVRATHGAYSARVWQSGAGSDRYASYTFFALEPGTYTVSVDVYTTATNATDYSRGMWLNSDNPNATFASQAYAATPNVWQTITRTATVTQSANSFTARFYAMTGADLYVDNLRVIKD